MHKLELLASKVAERNSWREPLLCFMEVSPVIPSRGPSNEIGKIKGWRVGLSYGRNLDNVECGFNYFGETVEEAIDKALVTLGQQQTIMEERSDLRQSPEND